MSKKLVAQFDITMPVDEMQVIPYILRAGHPVDEVAHKDFLANWKARGLIAEQETESKIDELRQQTTIGGGNRPQDATAGMTPEDYLEDGVARPQLSDDGLRVLVPGAEPEPELEAVDGKSAKKTK